jgi:outer membrane protein TolC
MIEDSGMKRLKLEGTLKGAWVPELERCWRDTGRESKLVVDLTDVEYVDMAGRYLLALMHGQGVRLTAATPMMEQMIAEFTEMRNARKSGLKSLSALLLTVCLAALVLPAAAQDAPINLDLARATTMAGSRNLEIAASKQGVITAKLTVDQAKASRYGRVSVDAGYLRLDDPVAIVSDPVYVPLFGGLTLPVPPTILAPADLLHVRLEAGLPLFTGGKITNAIAAAQAGRQAAEAVRGDTEASVVLQTGQLYLGVLLAREVVALNEQALESYQRHLEDARTAARMGVVANYDVVRAEAAVADQERRLTEARNRYDLVEAALKTELNLPETARMECTGSLFEPPMPQPLDEAQAAALKGNPGLEALAKKVEALERVEKMERGNYLPQIIAVAGKETVTSKLAKTDPNWFAGVQATWTLFDGGARRSKVAAKASEVAQARIEQRHAAEQVQLAVRSAFLEYESQKSALQSARKAAELARESLSLATKRFAVGAGTSLEALDANVALTAAEVNSRNSLFQMAAAYLRMHRYIGDIVEVAMRIQK